MALEWNIKESEGVILTDLLYTELLRGWAPSMGATVV